MKAITRKEALLRGEDTYRTGKPCKNGHNAKRYTLSGTCSVCIVEYKARERAVFRKAKAQVNGGNDEQN